MGKKKQEYCSSRSSLSLTSTAAFSRMHSCISDNNSAVLTCFVDYVVATSFIALSSVGSPHWSNKIGLWRKSLRQIAVSIPLLSAVFLSRLRKEVRYLVHSSTLQLDEWGKTMISVAFTCCTYVRILTKRKGSLTLALFSSQRIFARGIAEFTSCFAWITSRENSSRQLLKQNFPHKL